MADKSPSLPTAPQSKAKPGGYGLSFHDLQSMQRWELAIIILPVRDCEGGEFYTMKDIVPSVGDGTYDALRLHVKRIYPKKETRYRFNLAECERLIKFVMMVGVKSHSREELLNRAAKVLEARRN